MEVIVMQLSYLPAGFSSKIDLRIYDDIKNLQIEKNNLPAGVFPTTRSANFAQNANDNTPQIRYLKRIGIIECKTCKNRKYQDVSNDPGVSFKTPQNISPQFSASVVLAHEKEHITRETQKAKEEGKEVVSSSISLVLSTCPECGRVYVSGGKAKVVTKQATKDPFVQNYNNAIINHFGVLFDKVV